MEIDFTLNGDEETYEVERSDLLLDVLRDNGYTGSKRGCDTGACGFCTVIIDGETAQSCVTPVSKIDGADVETIEGLGTQDDPHPVQQAFINQSSLQCGFCIPGMIMSAKNLLENNPDPTDEEIRAGLEDNLCRCTGYKKIVDAVAEAATLMDGETTASHTGPSAALPDGGSACCEMNAACDIDDSTENGGDQRKSIMEGDQRKSIMEGDQ